MLVVHPPPGAAWPQASPQLAPWELYESVSQSWYECSGAFALHPHPWCHLLFPSIYDEGSLLATVVPHLHTNGRCHYVLSRKNMSFWFHIIRRKKIKLNNSKIKKERVEIPYLYRHMPILVVAACPGPPGNLSLHRGSRRWKLYVVATTERSQLDKGWTPYHPPVCA